MGSRDLHGAHGDGCGGHRRGDERPQILALQNQVSGLQNQVASMSNQLDCYGTFNVAQYPHSFNTSSGDLTPSAGGTWLDLMRPDKPANNPVYPLVINWCAP